MNDLKKIRKLQNQITKEGMRRCETPWDFTEEKAGILVREIFPNKLPL